MSKIEDFNIIDGVLVKYKGRDSNVVIPAGITSIGNRAFQWCKLLTSVVIPDGVTSIGDNAFEWCESLTNVLIPDSVTSIGNRVFYKCTSLKNIVIPNSVTSIGDGAFWGCKSLINIVIPDSVTSIGYETFRWCKSLTSIVISDSVTSIGDNAFEGCAKLRSIVIPENVTNIGYNAFGECTRLTSIVIPDSVTSIGQEAFSDVKQIIIKNIGVLKSDARPAAIAGFAACPSEYSPKDFKKYITYIKKNTSKLKVQAVSDVRLLKIMIGNDCLIPEMVDEYLLEAEKTNNLEAKTLLLSIKESKEMEDIFDLGDEIEEPGISGKTFVVTGDLKSMIRDEFKKFVSDRGGKLVGSISGKTNYLICNDISSATKKVTEARSLGIKVITEDEFFEMLGEE